MLRLLLEYVDKTDRGSSSSDAGVSAADASLQRAIVEAYPSSFAQQSWFVLTVTVVAMFFSIRAVVSELSLARADRNVHWFRLESALLCCAEADVKQNSEKNKF